MSASTDLDTVTLMQEIRELRQRLDDGPAFPSNVGNRMPSVTIKKDPAGNPAVAKRTEFPIYSGDKVTYPAWRRAVFSILKIDWNTFEYTDSKVFLMIYKALEGKAQRQAGAYFESGGVGGLEKPEDFIAFLDRGNWDPTRITRARSELTEMKMGIKERWNVFFPRWANKLTEAHGDLWPDETKITLLESALNHTLQMALVSNHLIPDNDYNEWISIVGHIAQRHDTLGKFNNRQSNLGIENNRQNEDPFSKNEARGSNNYSPELVRSGKERGIPGDLDSTGDTFMGGVFNVGGSRGSSGETHVSKWKSPEQIERLRREKRCYRCERQGCNTRICPLGPAKRPKATKGVSINVSDLSSIDPSVYYKNGKDMNVDSNNDRGSEN